MRILVVEDDEDLRPLIALELKSGDCDVDTCASASEALTALESDRIEVVLTDVQMSGMSGLELCARIVASRPEIPVIVMTVSSRLETAISAIRAGAYDFITKPLNFDVLRIAVARAAQHRQLRAEVRLLRSVVAEGRKFDDLLGNSDAMRQLYPLLEQIANSDASLLITGESGTGKEVVARAVHRRSRRGAGPLISVNCAAIPESLLESELFGHEKGAFTDARSARAGLFVQADRGTLFLDEIGELPIGLQPKLLRALEERKVRPIGGTREVPFDARVIVATNRDLETAIEERTFREDLYYRINVLHVELPPLRARGRDVLLLAQHFIDRFALEVGKPVLGLSSAAAAKLLAYTWPGNVRELRNCMERVVALARREEVSVEDLPEKIREHRSSDFIVSTAEPAELLSMEEVERRYILRVLDALGGNKRQAAKVLGFDRRTLYRKLEKYGVAVDEPDMG